MENQQKAEKSKEEKKSGDYEDYYKWIGDSYWPEEFEEEMNILLSIERETVGGYTPAAVP